VEQAEKADPDLC